jgi:putative tryptophan/tyrosine transport system substrate-binding protein
MRRREFNAILAGAIITWPFAAIAQEAGRAYRIGWLARSPRDAPYVVAFFDELRRHGFIEDQNLVIDAHSFGMRDEQFAENASELVQAKVDLILCNGEAAVRAAQKATNTIPILAGAENMVAAGLVRSLSNPIGNTTGFSLLAGDLDGKRLDLLAEMVPRVRRMAALADAASSPPQHLQMLTEAARSRGIELLIFKTTRLEEIPVAIDAAKKSDAAALNVLSSAMLYVNRPVILRSVATLGLPTIYPWPEACEAGGLIAYGPPIVQIYRDILARLAIKLLRGAKPSELPVEQPTVFELVVNVKAAKALDLTPSESFLARADEVIE